MKDTRFTDFISFTISFLLMTVIGTLSHEMGHFVVGKYYGWDIELHHASVSTKSDSKERAEYKYLYERHRSEIESEKDSDVKRQYETLLKQSDRKSFIFTLGGPLKTVLFGSLGFFLLLYYRNRLISELSVKLLGRILIFLTLFWLWQPFNLIIRILLYFYSGEISYTGDEVKLAHYLHLNHWSILVFLGIIGSLIAVYVIFSIIPRKYRMSFLLAGLLGGPLGYYLWVVQFGKFVLS